jgi:hypothetical protein
MNAIFPSDKLSLADYVLGSALLTACFIFFFHFDIAIVGWDALNYLFGNPLQFYENCKRIQGGGLSMIHTPYPPSIYVIFALWLYPLKVLGLITGADHFPIYCSYWLKALTTIVYGASGLVFYRITQCYRQYKSWNRYATALWLVSPLALFSQFIFSQYDIFYVILTLAGVLMFLRTKLFRAALCFGLAITFKYFPLFVFLPLLLLFEKRLAALAGALAVFALPTVLIQLLYGASPAFIEGVNNHGNLERVFAAVIDVGGWHIYYVFAAFTVLCGFAYLAQTSAEQLPRRAAYVYLAGTVFPFLFIVWHPQWTMSFAPAIVLTSVLDRRHRRFLVLDLFGMLAFVATVAIAFTHNADTAMFRGALWGVQIEPGFTMAAIFMFFGEHSGTIYLTAFWSYLLIELAAKFSAMPPAALSRADLAIDYAHVRYRLYIGLLLFLLPAAFTLGKDYLSGRAVVMPALHAEMPALPTAGAAKAEPAR